MHRLTCCAQGAALQQKICNQRMRELFPLYNLYFLFYCRRDKEGDGSTPKFK